MNTSYPNSLTDKQWQVIEKVINPQERTRKHSLRDIMNAMVCVEWRSYMAGFVGNMLSLDVQYQHCMKNISDSIRYIGCDDAEIRLFESQYVVPEGMCYNSYVILDEKVAIMDSSDRRTVDRWKANLAEALEGRKPELTFF